MYNYLKRNELQIFKEFLALIRAFWSGNRLIVLGRDWADGFYGHFYFFTAALAAENFNGNGFPGLGNKRNIFDEFRGVFLAGVGDLLFSGTVAINHQPAQIMLVQMVGNVFGFNM